MAKNENPQDQRQEFPLDEKNEPASGTDTAGGEVVFSYADLASVLECSEEDVRRAVQQQGPIGGVRALRSSRAPYLAIMGTFEARKRGDIIGVFSVLAHGESGDVLEKKVWASYGSMEKGFSIHAQWEAVRNAINAIEKPSDSSIYKQCNQVLDSYITPTSINLLSRSSQEKQAFPQKLKEGLNGAFHMDCFVQIRIEYLEEAAVRAVLPPPPKASETKTDPEMPGEYEVYTVACSPVVDPARGKPVVLLEKGDVVEVSFSYSSGLGKLICRYLDKAGKRPSFPVITKKRLPSGDYIVQIHISEGIEGIFKSSPSLMLRQGKLENLPGEEAVRRTLAHFATDWHMLLMLLFLLVAIFSVAYLYLH